MFLYVCIVHDPSSSVIESKGHRSRSWTEHWLMAVMVRCYYHVINW